MSFDIVSSMFDTWYPLVGEPPKTWARTGPCRFAGRNQATQGTVPKSKVWSFGDDDDRHPGFYHILHLNILTRYFPFDTYSEILAS